MKIPDARARFKVLLSCYSSLRYSRILSQLEYAYSTVHETARTTQKVFWQIPTREATKKARRIREFANRHPLITALVSLLVFTVFLPLVLSLVLFSAFVLGCLLIGLATALAFLIGCIVVVGIFSLPLVLPAVALTAIAAVSAHLGMRTVATAVRWALERTEGASLKPSAAYRHLQQRVSQFLLSCTADALRRFLPQIADGAQEETQTGNSDYCEPRKDDTSSETGRNVSMTDTQAGASGTTLAWRDSRAHHDVPQDDDAQSGTSDDSFKDASEWLTEDEFGNIIPDYRDRDMKLYDAMAKRGFKEYEPWPYTDM